MKFNVFNNAYDNTVSSENEMDYSFEELVELFSTHIITDNKDNLAFIASTFNLDRIERHAENVVNVTAICLDSDSDWTIEQAKQDLVGLQYFGYTSFSHRAPGKLDRFRIVLPLKTACPVDQWQLIKKDLATTFPQVDGCFTNRARLMYFPACPADREHLSQTWYQRGDEIDWTMFKKSEVPVYEVKEIDYSSLTREGYGEIIWETFDLVQLMKDHGFYQKQLSQGKHQIVCPNHANHSGGVIGGTLMWQDGNECPSVYCPHGHCKNFNVMTWAKNTLGKGWANQYVMRKKGKTKADLTNFLINLNKKEVK